ncbi:hypothetical protein CV093_18740 [Oceanobacillus sp. 143]|nr:hypothetical protein CV093_18740 [Oceanobacillus sp. 143]
MNPESHYNEFYIEDHIYAFHYSNAVCVGQSKSINSDNHNRFHETEFEYVDAIESYSGFFEVSAIQEGSFYDLVNDQTKIIESSLSKRTSEYFVLVDGYKICKAIKFRMTSQCLSLLDKLRTR